MLMKQVIKMQQFKKHLLIIIFLIGYISLSFELIVLRQLAGFVGSNAMIASIVIGIFLAFLSLGYYYGSQSKIYGQNIKKNTSKDFIILSLIIALASSYVLVDLYFSFLNQLGINSNILQTFIYSFIFLSFGPFIFGKMTALLSRYLHYNNHHFTGKIMAIDTIGSFLGSIITTLLIMPFLGVNYTIVAIVSLCLLGAFIINKNNIKTALLACIVLLSTIALNHSSLLYKKHNIIENNEISTISIYDVLDNKAKLMLINGTEQSRYSEDHNLMFSYVKYINDSFIQSIPQNEIKDILILGAGGFTIGIEDNINNYTFVDIDKTLKKISEEKFLGKKLGENKKFVVQDANQFLKNSDKKYDIIILDTYSSLSMIPFDLIQEEYFQRAKNRLNENGILIINSIVKSNFSNDFSKKFDNTIRKVFNTNLQRQTVGAFNPWNNNNNNVLYVFYNQEENNEIYNANKNSSFYDY